MSCRVLRLVERRGREVRLPRSDVAFLLAHGQPVIDLQPGFAARSFRLTPRGFVGSLDGPATRFAIRSKLPWPDLLMLLGLHENSHTPGERLDSPSSLLNVLAREFAARLREVVSTGLVRGYRECDRESPYLRGRLRTADYLRDAAARAFPQHFPITEDAFDLDTPWNAVSRAVAAELMNRPEVSASVRAELAAAAAPLESVPIRRICEADFEAASQEPRAAGYNGLLTLCRMIHDGFAASALMPGGSGAFLVDLGRVFERFLADRIAEVLADQPRWTVDVQPRFTLGHRAPGESIVLQPDLLLRRDREPWAVLDAKWKRPDPEPADLHQLLAYAAISGAERVGLVYPGRRFARQELGFAGRVRVTRFQMRITGTFAECRHAAARIVHTLPTP